MSRPPGTNQEAVTELIQMRLEMNLTQEQLAQKLGVSAWTVSRYESCKREPPLLYILALEQVYQTWLNRCYFN